jgi:hypothetical protein
MRVLFFFYRLQRHTNLHGLTNYVVPTPNLRLKVSHKEKHKVDYVYEVVERNLVENELEDDACTGSSGKFLLGPAMRKRSRQNDGESLKQKEAFTIRVCFTGASFEEEGAAKQTLFCTAEITPLRNFNMLGFITEKFLSQPKIPQKEKYNDWNDLVSCWKNIQQFESATNCGLTGDPCEHTIEPGGELGVFTLVSLLGAPLRMADWIRRNHKDTTNIQILGTPKLSFLDDEIMNQYVGYADEYLNEHSRWHSKLTSDIAAFCAASEKERRDMEFNLPAPGGWPLKSMPLVDDPRHTYLRFGYFPYPIVMQFKVLKFMSETVSLDSFQMNIGTLPKSVSKKARDFLTCEAMIDDITADEDDDSAIPDEDDDHILTERRLVNPLMITERFYSKNSAIGQELKTQGMMLTWYYSMLQKMQSDRARGAITPSGAMDITLGHIRQCLENHVGVMASGGYRSYHLEQAMEMIQGMHDTPLKDVLLADYVNKLRNNRVHHGIRHDDYLSISMVFSLSFADINREWKLSEPNAECLVDVLIGSLHYLLGSHSTTFTSLCACVMIMNAKGHLNLQDKEGVMMDWRKVNTSGAGFIQERINEFLKLLGVKYGIMPGENKQLFLGNNRFTEVSLENQCCVEISNGEIIGNPAKELNDQPLMMTEARSSDYTSLIKLGLKRDSNEGAVSMSTVDPNKTNIRATTFKVRRLLRWWGRRADTIFYCACSFKSQTCRFAFLQPT